MVWLTLFHISHRRCATGHGLLRCATSSVGHYFRAFGIFIWPPSFLRGKQHLIRWSQWPSDLLNGASCIVGQSSAATPPVWSPPTTMITNPPLPPSPASSGVCLSPGLEPVPQKLADRVCSGVYVEMRDLLGDNISLLRKLESVNIATTLPALPDTMKPRLREVSSLATWLYCFLAYMALRSLTEKVGTGWSTPALLSKRLSTTEDRDGLPMTRSFASMLHLTHPSSGMSSTQPFRLPHCLVLLHVGTRVPPLVVVRFAPYVGKWITWLPHVLWPICNSHPPQSALSQLVKAANDQQWPPTLCASHGIGKDAYFQSRAPSGTSVPAAFSSTQLWSVPVNGSMTHLNHLLQEPAQALGIDSDYLSSCYLNFPLSPSLPPVSHYVHCSGSIA